MLWPLISSLPQGTRAKIAQRQSQKPVELDHRAFGFALAALLCEEIDHDGSKDFRRFGEGCQPVQPLRLGRVDAIGQLALGRLTRRTSVLKRHLRIEAPKASNSCLQLKR